MCLCLEPTLFCMEWVSMQMWLQYFLCSETSRWSLECKGVAKSWKCVFLQDSEVKGKPEMTSSWRKWVDTYPLLAQNLDKDSLCSDKLKMVISNSKGVAKSWKCVFLQDSEVKGKPRMTSSGRKWVGYVPLSLHKIWTRTSSSFLDVPFKGQQQNGTCTHAGAGREAVVVLVIGI
jgi:hypothetical protein